MCHSAPPLSYPGPKRSPSERTCVNLAIVWGPTLHPIQTAMWISCRSGQWGTDPKICWRQVDFFTFYTSQEGRKAWDSQGSLIKFHFTGNDFSGVSPILDEERRWHHDHHGLPVKLESPLNFQVNFRFRDFRGACVGLVSGSIVSSAAMIGAVHRSSQSQ